MINGIFINMNEKLNDVRKESLCVHPEKMNTYVQNNIVEMITGTCGVIISHLICEIL